MSRFRPGELAARVGQFSAAHWRLVLVLWVLLGGLAAWQASSLEQRLKGEIGGISGSVSDQVMTRLSRDFDFPYAHFLVVTLESENSEDPEAQALKPATSRLRAALEALPGVSGTRVLPSADPRIQAIAIGLEAKSVPEEEAFVAPVRHAVARELAGASGIRALTTGHAALNADMVMHGSEETRRSEMLVLPLVLLALLMAFGALGAAIAPLISGAGAVLLSMGVLSAIAQVMPLSVYASNVATMLGLGLGIDYALLLVTRLREETTAESPDALRSAITHAAPIILTAAGTVLVGLAAMGTVPMAESIGMGIGGGVVALASLLASLTLLPALLRAMGPWVDAPRRFSRRFAGAAVRERWQARARAIITHPVRWLVLSLILLVALAAPTSRFTFGFPEFSLAPQQLESVEGLNTIQRMGLGGALVPVQILVSTSDRSPILGGQHLKGLSQLSEWLKAQPQVAEVHAIATPETLSALQAGGMLLGAQGLRERLPEEGKWLLSKDGTSTLVQVVPRNALSYREVRDFTEFVREAPWGTLPGLGQVAIQVGGPSAVESDFIATAKAHLLPLLALVTVASFLLLYVHTRSVLIPLKAIAGNLLTVGAAIGVTLFLFQHPTTAAWLGLNGPVPSVPAVYPIMVFCLLFGLSMDYEVMLIGRIHEEHMAGKSDREAIVQGLGSSGGVITSAAWIMTLVFAGFAFTDLVPVKLLGVALAVGVLLDATVTRLLLIPTLMALMGRWNWWPARGGISAPPASASSAEG